MAIHFHGHKLKYVLGWLFAGTRGAKTRIDIVRALEDKPQNANQNFEKEKTLSLHTCFGGKVFYFRFASR